MLLIFLTYHGEVGIDPWEYVVGVVYMMMFYVLFARNKNVMLKNNPEYRYYIPGLWMKLIGGFFLTMIYFYYYSGGDTTGYFYSGVAIKRMLFIDPHEYFRQVVLGDNSLRALNSYLFEPLRPYRFIFEDSRTFQVARLSSVLALLTFNSYLLSTLIMASISFYGVWSCYRTYVSYFPDISKWLAIGFLFMPSVVFWGSGILKDTLTFSAACAWIHALDEIFFKRRNVIWKSILAVIAAVVMIQVKPYVFMVILPPTLLWVLYMRVVRLRNVLIKFFVLPFMGLALVGGTLVILSEMGDYFDKFALEGALTNLEAIQGDMMNTEAYGENRFDVGKLDGTWWGVVEKFPVAVNATLFRPYLWESRSAIIALSGFENLFVLSLTIWVLFRVGPGFAWKCVTGVPLLLMSVTYALLFSFVVGISTPNFGALVRFKIPMVPIYVSSLYIILRLKQEKERLARRGYRFDIASCRMGIPGPARPSGSRASAARGARKADISGIRKG